MAKTLNQILGSTTLTGVINGIKGGVPDDILPPEFMRVNRTVKGDSAKYFKVNNTRQVARLVQYGSPSVARSQVGISEQAVKLMHSFEHQVFEPWVMENLRSPTDAVQRLGEAEIARQTAEFKRLFTNLRIAAVTSMLATGKIYFDANGNLLPSSSGAVITVDASIPAGNQNQLDVFGSGAIISAKWNVAGTDIPVQIANLLKAARKLTGYKLEYAFHGANILNYFTTNTKMKEIINRNTSMQTAVALNNEIPDGLLRLKWRPLYEAFYEDANGTLQDQVGDNSIIFTPTPTPDWWEVMQGTYPIPTSMPVGSDALSILSSVQDAPGMFSYATLTTDPVAIKQLAGDTFLPIIKVPGAVFIATVVW